MGTKARKKGDAFQSVYALPAIKAEMKNRGVDFLTAVKILEGSVIFNRATGNYDKSAN